jgi:hypothetical protein
MAYEPIMSSSALKRSVIAEDNIVSIRKRVNAHMQEQSEEIENNVITTATALEAVVNMAGFSVIKEIVYNEIMMGAKTGAKSPYQDGYVKLMDMIDNLIAKKYEIIAAREKKDATTK